MDFSGKCNMSFDVSLIIHELFASETSHWHMMDFSGKCNMSTMFYYHSSIQKLVF
jgi:hypothetical protein